MNSLKDITIIIPPHNRPQHLKRVLDYYSSCEVEIVIADSSLTKSSLEFSSNVLYYHLPNTSFTDKIHTVLEKVTTKYVMLLAEDDFYPIASIEDCVNFLDSNQDYDSCQGNYFLFDQNKPSTLRNIYYNSFNKDISEPLIHSRIENLYGDYIQLFYSVHNSNSLKNGFLEMYRAGIKNMFAVEWYIAVNSLVYGKHKVLNNIYGYRENIENSVGRNVQDFHYFVNSKETIDKYDTLVSSLSCKLNENFDLKDASTNFGKNTSTKISIFDRIKRRVRKYKIEKAIYASNPSFKKEWELVKNFILKYPIK